MGLLREMVDKRYDYIPIKQKPLTGQLAENEAVQEFFKLLMENRPETGRDYSIILWQMESMAHQLDMAMKELSEVKGQLAEMQESPVKKFVSHTIDAVEKRIHSMQEGLMDMKERIVEGAKEAVAGVKRTGIKALDKAVSAIGIKNRLEAMQGNLSASMADIKNTIEKVEAVGQELRSAGGHLKNVGRAAAGKEREDVDGGKGFSALLFVGGIFPLSVSLASISMPGDGIPFTSACLPSLASSRLFPAARSRRSTFPIAASARLFSLSANE